MCCVTHNTRERANLVVRTARNFPYNNASGNVEHRWRAGATQLGIFPRCSGCITCRQHIAFLSWSKTDLPVVVTCVLYIGRTVSNPSVSFDIIYDQEQHSLEEKGAWYENPSAESYIKESAYGPRQYTAWSKVDMVEKSEDCDFLSRPRRNISFIIMKLLPWEKLKHFIHNFFCHQQWSLHQADQTK